MSHFPSQQPFNLTDNRKSLGRVRHGKTLRDKTTGAIAQNRMNIRARGDWSRDGGVFPAGTCNGKKTQALRNRPSKKGVK